MEIVGIILLRNERNSIQFTYRFNFLCIYIYIYVESERECVCVCVYERWLKKFLYKIRSSEYLTIGSSRYNTDLSKERLVKNGQICICTWTSTYI